MERPLHFIEHIIEEDIAAGFSKAKPSFSFSTRTQWIFAYWSCESNLFKFQFRGAL